MLGRDIFVPEVPRDLESAVEDPRQLARRSRVGRGPRDLGLPVEVRFDLGRQSRRIDAELLKNRHDHAFALPEQGEQEMVRRQLGVAARAGVPLSFLDRFLGFDGELVESHVTNLSKETPLERGFLAFGRVYEESRFRFSLPSPAAIGIWRGLASGFFGNSSFRRPSAKFALTLSRFTEAGRVKDREN